MTPGGLWSRLVCAWRGRHDWGWIGPIGSCRECRTQIVIPPDYTRSPVETSGGPPHRFLFPAPSPTRIDRDPVRAYIGRVAIRGGGYDFGKWDATGPQRNVEDFCILAVRVVAWSCDIPGVKADDLTLRIGRTFSMNLASAPGAGAVLGKKEIREEGKGWISLAFPAGISKNDADQTFLLEAPYQVKLIIDVIANIARGSY